MYGCVCDRTFKTPNLQRKRRGRINSLQQYISKGFIFVISSTIGLWFIVVVVTIGATLGLFCIVICAIFGFKLVKIMWGPSLYFLEPKLTPLAQTQLHPRERVMQFCEQRHREERKRINILFQLQEFLKPRNSLISTKTLCRKGQHSKNNLGLTNLQ